MKKSILMLGAITLLLTAPSFAQEKTEKEDENVKTQVLQEENVKTNKKQATKSKLEAIPKKQTIDNKKF